MRFSVLGFNQEKVVQYGLKLDELLLLDYIMRANGNPKMSHILEGETSYVWLSHDKIQDDIPILYVTEGTLRNKLLKLKNDGFIVSKIITNRELKGSKAYYCITEKTLSLLYSNQECDNMATSMVSQNNDTKWGHQRMTPNSKLVNDSKLIEDLSYDKSYVSSPSNIQSNLAKTDDVIENTNNVTTDSLDEFNFGKKKEKPKNKNLYSKCLDIINNFTDDKLTRENLIDYLHFLLEKSQAENKPFYANQFSGLINKLSKLVEEGDDVNKVILYSLSKGYVGFYPENKSNNYSAKNNRGYMLGEQKIADRSKLVRDENGNLITF